MALELHISGLASWQELSEEYIFSQQAGFGLHIRIIAQVVAVPANNFLLWLLNAPEPS